MRIYRASRCSWRLIHVRQYSKAESPRINPVGIQYLSNHLHQQVFGDKKHSKRAEELSEDDQQELIRISRQYLKHHGLLGKKTSVTEPISFDLPQLQGSSLDEHFQKLGQFASQPYLDMAKSKFTLVPPRPEAWVRQSGWYRYAPGEPPKKVDYPLEETLVFDVETLYKVTPYPILAVAHSNKAWYCWCSPYLCGDDNPRHLIPLDTLNKTRLVIGHNVGYDRARVLEEYNCQESKAFFLDTMSLHIASSGMCSRQRPKWMLNKKLREKNDKESEDLDSLGSDEDPWITVSTMNSLKDVAKLHCGIDMDKEPRELLSTLDKNEIIKNFDIIVNYCATDVETTSQVFDKVFPLFLHKCPHPVSFGALRFLSTCILTTNKTTWNDYISRSEKVYQDSKQQIEDKIVAIIEDVVKLKDSPEIIAKDSWLKQLDWTIKPLRLTKKGVPVKGQKLPGYPEWYRSLFPSKNAVRPQITIKTRSIPLFFKLSWEGSPVFWTDEEGWCFHVPEGNLKEYTAKNYDIARKSDPKVPGHILLKVPHPNGQQFNCTTLLSKPYIHFFEKGILTSHSDLAHEALKINSSGSYWMSARERVMSQFVVPQSSFPDQFKSVDDKSSPQKDLAIILPTVIPMGTVTRRSVENTWLTASNAKHNRIGSELKAQIKAPPGYSFVGADVDSEELWIASLVSDSVFNLHGGTAIGWMCLEGSKNEGTDLHTRTAKILNCSRNEAKIFNYGRIYGAGVKFAGQLLKKFNPGLSDAEAKETAEKLYASTKGMVKRSKIFKKFWYGGSESILFNKLEHIAEQQEPKTPVLGAGITYSLMKRNLGANTFLPSRINWAIQSSGVDYLHLLCCSMNYLIKKYSIKARLCISIHDEIRFLAADEDKYRTAMALQISNIWTRAIFCEQMGIDDLPQNCAFFSAVDIDHVMRKEVDMDCVTPSNPAPIPHGESLDIRQLLSKPTSNLGPQSSDIDVSKLPYFYREPVFSKYSKAYSKEFLRYFLKMQVQTAKWKVDGLEDAYVQEFNEKAFKERMSTREYTFVDYSREIKAGERDKIHIMSQTHGSDRESLLRSKSTERSLDMDTNWDSSSVNYNIPIQDYGSKNIDAEQLSTSSGGSDINLISSPLLDDSKQKAKKPVKRKAKSRKLSFNTFNECIDMPREYADKREKQLSASTVVSNTQLDSIIEDTLSNPSSKSKNSTTTKQCKTHTKHKVRTKSKHKVALGSKSQDEGPFIHVRNRLENEVTGNA